MFVFRIKLFSDLIIKAISNTFDGKIAWYYEVFQIITLQPRDKNLLFLQGYLKSTVSKCMCLCFGFGDFSGKNNWKEIIDCESFSRVLASGQSNVMIIGLLVNTGAKYGASVYVCTLIPSDKDIKE